MNESNVNETLDQLITRADKVWGPSMNEGSSVSNLIGASELDKFAHEAWKKVARVTFVAPNFYLNIDDPNYAQEFNCLELGSDRDDRPLYYFLATGHYALASDRGLIPVARSSLEFFEHFLTYAEWVEEVISEYGPKALNDNEFLIEDVNELEADFTEKLGTYYKGSFWEEEIERLGRLTSFSERHY